MAEPIAGLGLVLPPWDLCGFDRDFDPYSDDGWWTSGVFGAHRAPPTPRDPNEADGRWREFAFMPHVEEWWYDFARAHEGDGRSASLWVPVYSPVGEALTTEWLNRAFLAKIRAVGSVHERVACPKCGAPVGERCRNLSKRPDLWRVPQLVKHPHRERLRAAGISMR